MGFDFETFPVTLGHGESGAIMMSWEEYQSYSDEEYKTTPKIFFHQKLHRTNGLYVEEVCDGISLPNALAGYDYRVAISVERIISTGGRVNVWADPGLVNEAATYGGKFGADYRGERQV